MKIRPILFTAIFFWSAVPLMAGQPKFPVAEIPAALLKDAHAVVRMEEERFEIRDHRHSVHTHYFAITILDETADDLAQLSEYYNGYRKIHSAEGALYDAKGGLLRKMKLKDMTDVSGVGAETLMEDYRFRRHNFYHRVYPYTIAYTVVTTQSSGLFYPSWTPVERYGLSVEKSSFSMVCPPWERFRFRAYNYPGSPVQTKEKDKTVSTWSVQRFPAQKKEPYATHWQERVPMVLFAPVDFQVDTYSGSMKSWSDFGRFVYTLKAGRDELPLAVRAQVHALTDTITQVTKKIETLYAYLQQHTRYVSIQLGIGGWQPFDARFVAEKSYGDCKALANYMYSLLKEAGIRSLYALVRAGEEEPFLADDFPSQQFNHVILCVPKGTDTTWLECTSQTLPAGYLGSFTADRYALCIEEAGGTLVRTPRYGYPDNQVKRVLRAVLDEAGELKAEVFSDYSGLLQDDRHDLIHQLSAEKVRQQLQEELDLPTYEVTDFRYTEKPAVIPHILEELRVTVKNYATSSGRRLFIEPNVMSRSRRRLEPDSGRKHPVVMNGEYATTDTVTIQLPPGYTLESMPPDQQWSTPYGEYRSSLALNGTQLTYYRYFRQYSGRFAVSDYAALVKFYEQVYRADRGRVVMVRGGQ